VEEKYRLRLPGSSGYSDWQIAGGGYKESLVIERARGGDPIAQIIRKLLRRCIVHQFHNTSETARIRQRWDTHDARYLKEDGGNLAPVLLRLREEKPQAYRRIIDTVRLVVPFFADFFLEPSNGSVFLQWTEKGTDVVFGAHQASDGTLRTLALITLLLQPIEDVPDVLILDEPELGLHPYAVTVIAGLIKSISLHRQVLLATQSITLLNQFAPEDVIVVNRRGRESEFTRLDPQGLSEWIEEYSLGELWEKNVIGGRPHR
jgi:predicted ATPase